MRFRRGFSVFWLSCLLAACAATDGRYGGRGWELLGQREADLRMDRDRIEVGRQRFDENASSREIDLPGDRRVIRSVDFAYRSLNRLEGRATVMLYGR